MTKLSSYIFRKDIPQEGRHMTDWSEDRWITFLGLTLLVLTFVYYIYVRIRYGNLDGAGVTCLIRAVTGLKCPGCGATHALLNFYNGHWVTSFTDNAFAFVVLLTLYPYTVLNLLHELTHGRVWGIRFHYLYLWFYLAVFALNVLIQNLVILLG